MASSIVRHIKSFVIWDKFGTSYEFLSVTLTEWFWTWQFLSLCWSPILVQWFLSYVVAERYVVEGLASSGNKCYGSKVRLGCVLVEWILTVMWYYLLWIIELTKSTTEFGNHSPVGTSSHPNNPNRCVNVRAREMLIFLGHPNAPWLLLSAH